MSVPWFASLRLWLVKRLLPRGYAIWTWGRLDDDGLDLIVLSKDLPE